MFKGIPGLSLRQQCRRDQTCNQDGPKHHSCLLINKDRNCYTSANSWSGSEHLKRRLAPRFPPCGSSSRLACSFASAWRLVAFVS